MTANENGQSDIDERSNWTAAEVNDLIPVKGQFVVIRPWRSILSGNSFQGSNMFTVSAGSYNVYVVG